MKSKVIFHMDGDAFFVGVEIAKNQKLKGLPVVTGEERGIVSALSYEAKALGVTRGLPIFLLKKQFPQVIILPGDYESYANYSTKMFEIVRRYIDDVEEYSIDECFGDLTGLDRPLKMSYREIAERIKSEINKELNLSISIGIGPTKVLSKVASKWIKPNGLTIIELSTISNFLSKTPVGKIWGIGAQTSMALIKYKVFTAQDFISKDLEWVRENFSKPQEVLWHELQGIPLMEIDPIPKTIYSSMQSTHSFHPFTDDKVFLLSQLSMHIEDACTKARHYHLIPKSISFFLKTKDFKYISFAISLRTPTNAPEILISLIQSHFNKVYKKGILYRTTGISLFGLTTDTASQGDLFGGSEKAHKFELIHKQMDELENKYGKKVVYIASTHNAYRK